MSSRPNWVKYLRYRMDLLISSGPLGLILLLGVLSLLVVTFAAVLITLIDIHPAGSGPLSFFEAFWEAMMRTLDPGTMGGDTGRGFRLVMFMVTIGGIFIISSLIGVLSSGLEEKIQELSKGHSQVIERGHIVILGWSRQVLTIISEVVAANANKPHNCIVVLADEDKGMMEERIRTVVDNPRRTRILCRSGSPLETANLDMVSINTSRAILVMPPEDATRDAEVIKTVLAILNLPGRRKEPFHVVAELRDPSCMEIGAVIGGTEVEWIEAATLVARVVAQTSRQSGLSVVYTDLLDYAGDEIYVREIPQLNGKTYGEALFWFEKNALFGILPAGGLAPGEGPLNPPMDRLIQPGDSLILLAEDDDKIVVSPKPRDYDPSLIGKGAPSPAKPEKHLLLGWNRLAPTIVMELDHYVSPGSQVEVVAMPQDFARDYFMVESALVNQRITFREGDTTSRATLENLGLFDFDHIIVLCYAHRLSPQQADAHTLITLLHLRDMAKKAGKPLPVVSEMLDSRNRELAQVAHADDVIISDNLISLVMAQVAEKKDYNIILRDLSDNDGSEVYLKPMVDYIRPGQPVTFYTVMAAARERGETAFGYRLHALTNDPAQNYGVVINPAKSQVVTFSALDRIIVLAES